MLIKGNYSFLHFSEPPAPGLSFLIEVKIETQKWIPKVKSKPKESWLYLYKAITGWRATMVTIRCYTRILLPQQTKQNNQKLAQMFLSSINSKNIWSLMRQIRPSFLSKSDLVIPKTGRMFAADYIWLAIGRRIND